MTGRQVRLGDVADVLRGTIPAKTSPEPNGPRFFGLAEISERSSTELRYPEPNSDLTRAVYLQEGDVVVALLGRLGESALIGQDLEGAVLGRECAVIRLRPHEERLTPSWLYAWTRSRAFRHLTATSASGTTMPRLPVRSLDGLMIPIEAVDVQRGMAARLDGFENALDLIEHTSTMLKRLREVEIDLAFDAAGAPAGE